MAGWQDGIGPLGSNVLAISQNGLRYTRNRCTLKSQGLNSIRVQFWLMCDTGHMALLPLDHAASLLTVEGEE